MRSSKGSAVLVQLDEATITSLMATCSVADPHLHDYDEICPAEQDSQTRDVLCRVAITGGSHRRDSSVNVLSYATTPLFSTCTSNQIPVFYSQA